MRQNIYEDNLEDQYIEEKFKLNEVDVRVYKDIDTEQFKELIESNEAKMLDLKNKKFFEE